MVSSQPSRSRTRTFWREIPKVRTTEEKRFEYECDVDLVIILSLYLNERYGIEDGTALEESHGVRVVHPLRRFATVEVKLGKD